MASYGFGTLSPLPSRLLPSCPLQFIGLLVCLCTVWSTFMVHSFQSLPVCLYYIYTFAPSFRACLFFESIGNLRTAVYLVLRANTRDSVSAQHSKCWLNERVDGSLAGSVEMPACNWRPDWVTLALAVEIKA